MPLNFLSPPKGTPQITKPTPTGVISFLKKGDDSIAVAKQQKVEAEARKEMANKLLRFWLKDDKDEARITFIDGDLDEDGLLVPTRWYEHKIFINGQYYYFPCPVRNVPSANDFCPLDEANNFASLVSGFTIIDHRQFKSTKSDKVFQNTKKLLIAKPYSFELLYKHAVKRGGLAGCTFDVSRVGEQSASIGSMFDFVSKTPIEELKKMYVEEVIDPKTNIKSMVTYFTPANFDEEITYRTGAQLKELLPGVGTPIMGSTGAAKTAVKLPDYGSQL